VVAFHVEAHDRPESPVSAELSLQLGLLRAAERACITGVRAIVLPDLAYYGIAEALAPMLPVPIIGVGRAVLEALSTDEPCTARVRLISTLSVDVYSALAAHFANAGIELSIERIEYVGQAVDSAVADAITRARGAGIERLCLGDDLAQLVSVDSRYEASLIDSAAACARAVLALRARKPFKLGVVGGVGPAATVAFLDHIVQSTPARRDQEHLKLIIEQNPQIPDRTAYLLGNGVDPTLALLAICEDLQRAGATAIAIPCNTAHAFIERIAPALRVPVVHMPREAIRFVANALPAARTLGLLATDGTIATGLYHDEARAAGLAMLVPDVTHQRLVMDAIYGPGGVKAGQRDSLHRDAIGRAVGHLASRGSDAIILGCTELPLLLPHQLDYCVDGFMVPVVDPAKVLALRCVELSARTD